MELSLVNYQAWEKAHLNVEGLTVVVGPSNRGKSSFGRALKGAFRNDVLPAHIRLGSPGVEVKVRYNTLDLSVTRGAKAKDSTIYYVGDQKFEKLGGDIPDDVKAQNFGPVEVNGVKIDPIFAGQFDAQFLLGSSPAELNAILNAFASTERLDKGRKVIASRVTETNATAKALTPQISGLEEQAASLGEKLTVAEPALEVIQAVHARVTKLQAALDALELLQASRRAHDTLVAQQDALARLERDLGRAVKTYKGLVRAISTQTAKQTIETTRIQTAALQRVESAVPVAIQANKGLVTFQALLAAQAALQNNGKFQAALDTVAESLKAPLRYYKALVRVKAVVAADPSKLKILADQIVALDTSRPEKILAAGIILQKLQGLRGGGAALQDSLDLLGQEAASLTKEMEAINTQIEKARQAGVVVTCPKCHHEFTPDHSH